MEIVICSVFLLAGDRFCVASVSLLRETNGYSWTLGLKKYGAILDVIQTDLEKGRVSSAWRLPLGQ